MTPKSKTERLIRLTDSQLVELVCRHLRWLREAYEELYPGQHSQTQWARRFDVTQTRISRWEAGKLIPSLDVLFAVELTTGCSWEYLYYGVLSQRMPPEVRQVLGRRHKELVSEADWRKRIARLREQAGESMLPRRDMDVSRSARRRRSASSKKPSC